MPKGKYNGLPMVKGYILIKLLPGFESSAMSQIRATSGVLEVNFLFGHWDAIAVAEAKSLHELSRLVLNQIRGIQGVQDTETLVHGEI
jgi:DNA-binding Lrp family transcriptional regulator